MWRTVYSLLQATGLDELQAAAAGSIASALPDKEEHELRWRIREMKILRWYTSVPVLLGLTFMPRGGIVSSLRALPDWGGRILVGGACLLGIVLTIILFVFIDRTLAARAKREWLGALRMRLNPARMLAVLAIGAVGFAHFFYRLLDTAPHP